MYTTGCTKMKRTLVSKQVGPSHLPKETHEMPLRLWILSRWRVPIVIPAKNHANKQKMPAPPPIKEVKNNWKQVPSKTSIKSDIDIFHFLEGEDATLQQKAPLPSLCLPLLPFPWLLAPFSPFSPFPPFPFSTSGLSMDGGSMEHTKSSWPPRKSRGKNGGKND